MELNQRHAEVMGALADVHRLLLFYMMAEAPQNVGTMVRRVGLSQPAVSRHLRIMREVGVVCAERRGKSIYYSLLDKRLVGAMDTVRAVIADEMQKQGDAARAESKRPVV